MVSAAVGPLVLASPPHVLQALFSMIGERSFYTHLGVTLLRLAAIFLLAAPGGAALALPAAFDRRIEQLMEPFRWLCMTVPSVIVVVVLMFCMGMGSQMIVVFGTLILWPIMYINVLKGSAAVDSDLLEMARVYRLSRRSRLRHVILPVMMPSILAGAAQITCGAIRVTILAEVIGADNGIGAAVASTARNLETARMNAWALIALLLAIGMEFAVLRPLQQRVYQWKKQ
jgi:NitT/TauT family transport system permease protein